MSLIQKHIVSNDIERHYSGITSLEHRKKFAQFFTPPPIADIMAKWILGNNNIRSILEPAFGLGVFSRALLNYRQDLVITGFETDENIFEHAKHIFADNDKVTLLLEDYTRNDWDHKYEGIICNPPYFKFHDYDNIGTLKEINEKLGCNLNGFTNLYTLFILKSVFQLKKNGRAAYIVPSEFLNSDYGKLVKSYLIKSKSLRYVVIIDFEEVVFDDALTTACILLFANDDNSKGVRFINAKNIEDLNQLEDVIQEYPVVKDKQLVSFSNLNPGIKWRAYYQAQNSIKYQHLIPFSNYGKVVRGIATGANEYFIFNSEKANKFQIDKKYLLPCICRAMDVRRPFFTQDDFEQLQELNKPVFLFNAMDARNDSIKKYIQKGLDEGIHKQYLTSKRNPWYALENRPPAPIWVSVFNRNGLRFIRNEANVHNLTTFHCIYPTLFALLKSDLFFAYLLTDIAKEIFDDNRREYGNGLQKFEPNDINNAKMLDLGLINKVTETKICNLFRQYRQAELDENIKRETLLEINNIFLEYFSEGEREKGRIEKLYLPAEHAELVIRDRHGKIRDKDSYGPDPCPPKDKRH